MLEQGIGARALDFLTIKITHLSNSTSTSDTPLTEKVLSLSIQLEVELPRHRPLPRPPCTLLGWEGKVEHDR